MFPYRSDLREIMLVACLRIVFTHGICDLRAIHHAEATSILVVSRAVMCLIPDRLHMGERGPERHYLCHVGDVCPERADTEHEPTLKAQGCLCSLTVNKKWGNILYTLQQ